MASYTLHKNDLSADVVFKGSLAIDTEAMGLNPHRDRLCVAQMKDEVGEVHIVHFDGTNYDAPNLKRVLTDEALPKIFHFARFDVALLRKALGVQTNPLFCTKIASRLTRTFVSKHGLKDLCRDLLDIDISKQQQTSDWGAPVLNESQLQYAAGDVLYLHKLKEILEKMLVRENRALLAQQCFQFLNARAELDLLGFSVEEKDLFDH